MNRATKPAAAAAITWRGITLRPEPETRGGFWRSEPVPVTDIRTADWKVHKAGSSWYARLRVGSDRFPGRGVTPEAALDDAAKEAKLVMRFIRTLMPRKGAA
jgi:hypothetical protein